MAILPHMAHQHTRAATSAYKAQMWAQTANRMLNNGYPMSDAIEHANAALDGMNAQENEPVMREVYIVRHGATEMNNDDISVDRIRGWKNIPLSVEGQREAQYLAGELSALRIDQMVASDLKRAHDTARIISRVTNIPVVDVSKDFRPWNVGIYAGQHTKEAIPELVRYVVDQPDNKVPDGESFNEFKRRFFSGLSRVLTQYSGRTAVVTHHRGERLTLAWRAAGMTGDGSIDNEVFCQKGEAPGSVTRVEINPSSLMNAASTPSIEVEKVTQEAARYTDFGYAATHCGNCRHYEGLKCHLVLGSIKPEGWCMYYEPRGRYNGE